MKKKQKNLPFRRKRQSKTDYKNRLRLLAAKKPRLVVRKSVKNVLLQIAEFHPDGDRILLSASTKELQKKYGWNNARRNIPAAYLTGYLLGSKAKEKEIKEAVLDIGLRSSVKGSILAAALKGAVDAGMEVPHAAGIYPPEDRIRGMHMKVKDASFEKVKEAMSKVKRN